MTQLEWDEFRKRVIKKLDSVDHARIQRASFNVSYFPVSGSNEEVLGEGCLLKRSISRLRRIYEIHETTI